MAGKSAESTLFELIDARHMPPEGEGELTAAEISLIGRWIDAGALMTGAESNTPSRHDVIPILLLRCVTCHGGRLQEGGLDLRTPEAALRGGKSGPAVLPGKPKESLLLQRIHAGEMPPRRRIVEVSLKPPEPDEIEKITRWIAAGAPLEEPPQEPPATISAAERDFWSFQPPRDAPPPVVRGAAVRTPVDAFIAARLQAAGLDFAAEADRRTLIRRLSLDLLGLPPSPEEVAQFLADDAADAYERLVERLLASPHYGERWGRFWLDLAGYSDSEGVQHSDPLRANNWRYRDYVIRSFNADKSYDRFLCEQLAGDELEDPDQSPPTPQIVENLTATGFLRQAPDGTFSSITAFVPDRLEVISAEIEILSSAVLGLTFKCARCHSHKFDPISQRDYYRLAAVFKGALDEHDWLKPTAGGEGMHSPFGVRDLAKATPQEQAAWEANEVAIDAAIAAAQTERRQAADPLRMAQRSERLQGVPEEIRADVRQAFETPTEQRTDVQKYLAEKFARLWNLTDEELTTLAPEFRPVYERTAAAIQSAAQRRRPAPAVRALWDRGEPSPTYVLRRGDYRNPGDPVQPGVPALFDHLPAGYQPAAPWPGARSTGRRLAFARWLTQPEHPLTARVLVNRVWRHHFGRGIVSTLDNFGKTGAPPSHPELLDWLAREFVRQGWSLKSLHRLLVTSQVYRQSSVASDPAAQRDPENQLWSRMPLRRLEAEALRDALLAISGVLDPTLGGPADGVDVRPDGLVTERGWRRSVYLLQRRTQMPTFLEAFDLPRMGPNCIDRQESNVAPQALMLLNSRRLRELSDHFAARVQAEAGADPAAQIDTAVRWAWLRAATAQERPLLEQTLGQLTAEWSTRPAAELGGATAAQKALGNVCHALLNSAELLYID